MSSTFHHIPLTETDTSDDTTGFMSTRVSERFSYVYNNGIDPRSLASMFGSDSAVAGFFDMNTGKFTRITDSYITGTVNTLIHQLIKNHPVMDQVFDDNAGKVLQGQPVPGVVLKAGFTGDTVARITIRNPDSSYKNVLRIEQADQLPGHDSTYLGFCVTIDGNPVDGDALTAFLCDLIWMITAWEPYVNPMTIDN